jgi:hypothetical protein
MDPNFKQEAGTLFQGLEPMLRKINHKRSSIPSKSMLAKIACLLPFLFFLLLAPHGCQSGPPENTVTYPVGLKPLMNEIRVLSRDLKRALILENQDQYAPNASALAEASLELKILQSTEAFNSYAKDLWESAEIVSAAVKNNKLDRLDDLFGEFIDGCIRCHQACRIE